MPIFTGIGTPVTTIVLESVSPASGAIDQALNYTQTFNVVSYGPAFSGVNAINVRCTVDGVTTYAFSGGAIQSGYSGSVGAVTNGYGFSISRTGNWSHGKQITYIVEAADGAGGEATFTFNVTTVGEVSAASTVITDARTVTITLNQPVANDAVTKSPESYAISYRTGSRGTLKVASVSTGAETTTSSIVLTTAEFIERRSAIELRVAPLADTYGFTHGFTYWFVDSTSYAYPPTFNTTTLEPSTPLPTAPSMFWRIAQRIYKKAKVTSSSVWGALIYAIAWAVHAVGGDEATFQGIRAARDGLIIEHATGTDLVTIGSNLGVNKPREFVTTDSMFRDYIKLMAYKPKCIVARVSELLTILFGARGTGWELYEPKANCLVVELISSSLMASGDPYCSYLQEASTSSPDAKLGDYIVGADTDTPTVSGNNCPLIVTSVFSSPALEELVKLVTAAGVNVKIVTRGL